MSIESHHDVVAKRDRKLGLSMPPLNTGWAKFLRQFWLVAWKGEIIIRPVNILVTYSYLPDKREDPNKRGW